MHLIRMLKTKMNNNQNSPPTYGLPYVDFNEIDKKIKKRLEIIINVINDDSDVIFTQINDIRYLNTKGINIKISEENINKLKNECNLCRTSLNKLSITVNDFNYIMNNLIDEKINQKNISKLRIICDNSNFDLSKLLSFFIRVKNVKIIGFDNKHNTFPSLPNLKRLSIHGSSEINLNILDKLPNIEILKIYSSYVELRNYNVEKLKNMKKILIKNEVFTLYSNVKKDGYLEVNCVELSKMSNKYVNQFKLLINQIKNFHKLTLHNIGPNIADFYQYKNLTEIKISPYDNDEYDLQNFINLKKIKIDCSKYNDEIPFIFNDDNIIEILKIRTKGPLDINDNTLIKLKNLKHLEIDANFNLSISENALKELKNLEIIIIKTNGVPEIIITSEKLIKISGFTISNLSSKYLKNLKYLSMDYSENLSDEIIYQSDELEYLHIHRNDILTFEAFKNMNKLKQLYISECKKITFDIFKYIKNIEEITINYCDGVYFTYENVMKLSEQLSNLKKIKILKKNNINNSYNFDTMKFKELYGDNFIKKMFDQIMDFSNEIEKENIKIMAPNANVTIQYT